MIDKHPIGERLAVVTSITVTILSWSYIVAEVGGKLIAPLVI